MAGVFRQIGTVLSVAIFVSALSSNLVTAKVAVWYDAQADAQRIGVTKAQRKKIIAKTYRDIYVREGASSSTKTAVSVKETTQLIRANVTKYLTAHNGNNLPATAKQQFTTQVTKT